MMNAASSDSRNLTGPTTSLGTPRRPIGVRPGSSRGRLIEARAHLNGQIRGDQLTPIFHEPSSRARAGHRVDAPLGRPVDRHAAISSQAHHGGDIHDRAAAISEPHRGTARRVSVMVPLRLVAIARSIWSSRSMARTPTVATPRNR